MRLILIISFIIVMASISYCQVKENIKVDVQNEISTTLLQKRAFSNKDNTFELLKNNLLTKITINDASEIFNTTVNKDILKEWAIVFVKHRFKYDSDNFNSEDLVKSEVVILHLEGDKWSDYLLETKKVLIIILGGANDLQLADISIEREKSYFRNSFDDLVNAGGTILGALGANTLPVRIILLNPHAIINPCNIKLSAETIKEPIKVKVHEKSNFSFQLGVAGQQLDKHQFKLQNQSLIVSLDSTQKKEWKSNIIAQLVWHPGRDIDRFDPVWKQNIKDETIKYQLKKWTISRLGLFAGARLSSDPIQNLYLGVNYAVTKDLYFNAGFVWTNQLTTSITSIGSITNVDEALKYADRKYMSAFFYGISFSPSQMVKNLGLDKDKAKEKD